jgi:TATA-box binding protein (TBP) (component of TFIID and TFIIIB)
MVMGCSTVNRVTGEIERIGEETIDYRAISNEHVGQKLQTQRQLRTFLPRSTALCYFTGSVLNIGSRGPLDAICGMYTVLRVLRNHAGGGSSEFVVGGVKWHNGVYYGSFRRALDLKRLCDIHSMEDVVITYDANHFAGAILNRSDGTYIGTLFGKTGKFIFGGITDPHDVITRLRIISAVVQQLRQQE